jgi:hypothetical protein
MAIDLLRSTLLVHRAKSPGEVIGYRSRENERPSAAQAPVKAAPIEIDAYIVDDDESEGEVIEDAE